MTIRDLAGEQWAQAGFGLAIGTLARYALRIQDRLAIGWREVAADVMLLGLNAVLTLFAIDRLGATGKGAVLTAALFGIAQDRVIRVLRRRMEKRAAALEAALFGEEPTAARSVPQRHPLARSVLGKGLRRVHQAPTREGVPADHADLIDKLDEED